MGSVVCYHNTYRWIEIHSVDSVIHPLNNWGLVFWEFFFSLFHLSKWFYIKRVIRNVGSLQFFCLFQVPVWLSDWIFLTWNSWMFYGWTTTISLQLRYGFKGVLLSEGHMKRGNAFIVLLLSCVGAQNFSFLPYIIQTQINSFSFFAA